MSDQIPIDKIKPSPYQPRLTFDLEDIRGSIQKDGILVALTVRKRDGYYELVDGERRLRLAKDLGYKTVKCDIIDVDDDVARRMVWKVNTLRKDYTPKEKAYHFKKLQKMGMAVNAIALDCDIDWHTIIAHLNVLKLPQSTQNVVWESKKLSVSHIQELEDLFNGSVDTEGIGKWIKQTLEQKLTSKELREARKPELRKIERKRVESAKKAVGKITTEVKEPKTPDELDKAAEVLRREAKKKRESKLSSEEKNEPNDKLPQNGNSTAIIGKKRKKGLKRFFQFFNDFFNVHHTLFSPLDTPFQIQVFSFDSFQFFFRNLLFR